MAVFSESTSRCTNSPFGGPAGPPPPTPSAASNRRGWFLSLESHKMNLILLHMTVLQACEQSYDVPQSLLFS